MTTMRHLVVVVLVAGIVLSSEGVLAIEGNEVLYVNGTANNVKQGTVGRLNKSSETALLFESGAGQIEIPYTRIVNYQYREESKFHLGVLPAIAVSLLKKRAKVHYVSITWTGEHNTAEVVTLEMSKRGSEGLLAVLRARAIEVCKGRPRQASDGVQNGVRPTPIAVAP